MIYLALINHLNFEVLYRMSIGYTKIILIIQFNFLSVSRKEFGTKSMLLFRSL